MNVCECVEVNVCECVEVNVCECVEVIREKHTPGRNTCSSHTLTAAGRRDVS